MPQAVIFDIDGTLVDSVDFHAQAWVEALSHFGYEIGFEEMKQKIGKGGDLILQEVLPAAVTAEQRDEISNYRERHFHNSYVDKVKPFPKVRSLFERLRQDGMAIVLATSAEPELAQHYQEMLKVGDLVEGVTSAGDVEQAKPAPDVFEVALEQFEEKFAASEVMVVGDSPYDAKAASKIGLRTVGLLSGDFAAERLTEAGCVAVYQDIADLLEQYERSPLAPMASAA
ncbi:MAG: HAD family phosphatase [Leptolyngbya sp. SIO4C1]|nr:HAD family phosphatase [Leptolyngbya sp. SIO4C1]